MRGPERRPPLPADGEAAAGAAADLLVALTRFCRALRARGVLLTPAESVEAARVLGAVDVADREEVFLALRALLTSSYADYSVFDEVFAAWWRAEGAPSPVPPPVPTFGGKEAPAPPPPATTRAEAHDAAGAHSRSLPELRRWSEMAEGGGDDGDAASGGAARVAAASTNEALFTKDFSTYPDHEIEAIARVAARMARRLTSRPSRRWKAARRGERLHVPRTMRRALATGDAVELARSARKRRPTKLVALCDVSGSMDLYSRFLLQLLYALQHAFARVESFAFSTGLHRITSHLARGTYRQALDRLAREVPGWSGGTKIGDSVAALSAGWPRLVDRRTVLVVLSDGWDTGDPAVLADALAALRRRAGRVVWLNPLLGSPGYEPLTRGMQAALPHVDVFAPVHNLESFERLVPHLSL